MQNADTDLKESQNGHQTGFENTVQNSAEESGAEQRDPKDGIRIRVVHVVEL